MLKQFIPIDAAPFELLDYGDDDSCYWVAETPTGEILAKGSDNFKVEREANQIITARNKIKTNPPNQFNFISAEFPLSNLIKINVWELQA